LSPSAEHSDSFLRNPAQQHQQIKEQKQTKKEGSSRRSRDVIEENFFNSDLRKDTHRTAHRHVLEQNRLMVSSMTSSSRDIASFKTMNADVKDEAFQTSIAMLSGDLSQKSHPQFVLKACEKTALHCQ